MRPAKSAWTSVRLPLSQPESAMATICPAPVSPSPPTPIDFQAGVTFIMLRRAALSLKRRALSLGSIHSTSAQDATSSIWASVRYATAVQPSRRGAQWRTVVPSASRRERRSAAPPSPDSSDFTCIHRAGSEEPLESKPLEDDEDAVPARTILYSLFHSPTQ